MPVDPRRCVAHVSSPVSVGRARACAGAAVARLWRGEGTMKDEEIFEEVAARLDDLERAPIVTLSDLVTREGACMWIDVGVEEPTSMGDEATDRELAATICAG